MPLTKRVLCSVLASALALMALTPVSHGQVSVAVPLAFREEALTALENVPAKARDIIVNPTGTLYLAIVENNGRWSVIANGRTGAVYDEIRFPVYSRDNNHYAYAARTGQQWKVVTDGIEGSAFDWVDAPVFSVSGERITYMAGRDGKPCLVVNNRVLQSYDAIGWFDLDGGGRPAVMGKRNGKWRVEREGETHPAFDFIRMDSFRMAQQPLSGQLLSTQSPRYAYIANNGGRSTLGAGEDDEIPIPAVSEVPTGGQWFVVVDGQPGAAYDEIAGAPVFSHEGSRVAYAARKGEQWFIVVNQQAEPAADEVGRPVFSLDGKHLSYAARHGDKWTIVADGKSGADHTAIIGWPIFSGDGRHLIYVARNDDGWQRVYSDGVAGAGYEEIKDIIATYDGSRLAYAGRRDHSWIAVVDGQESQLWDVVRNIVFSSDGKRVTCVTKREGKQFIVVDGQLSQPWDAVRNAVFTQDGAHVAYIALLASEQPNVHSKAEYTPDEYCVIDQTSGKPFDVGGNLQLGSAGRQIIYTGSRGRGHFVVVNGVESSAYEQIWMWPSAMSATATTATQFLALRRNTIFRVRVLLHPLQSTPTIPQP